jgi:Lysozyme like domain
MEHVMTRAFTAAIALALATIAISQSAEAADKGKLAKKGGATSDQAATMTAIALAESGGRTDARKGKRLQMRARKRP